MSLLKAGGLEPDDLQGPFQPLPFYDSMKSGISNLITFYDEVTGLLNEGRAVNIVYFDFSEAFNTVSHNVFIEKLFKRGLDERTGRWT